MIQAYIRAKHLMESSLRQPGNTRSKLNVRSYDNSQQLNALPLTFTNISGFAVYGATSVIEIVEIAGVANPLSYNIKFTNIPLLTIILTNLVLVFLTKSRQAFARGRRQQQRRH